jgi:hypothetical protein
MDEAVMEVRRAQTPDPPAGSFSTEDVARERNLSRSAAGDLVRVLRDAGKLKSAGKFNRRPYYFLNK